MPAARPAACSRPRRCEPSHCAARRTWRRVRELHLGLHAGGSQHTEFRCLLNEVLKQRCLAYASLAAQDERLALALVDSLDQPVKTLALVAPADELYRVAPVRMICRHFTPKLHLRTGVAVPESCWNIAHSYGLTEADTFLLAALLRYRQYCLRERTD